MTKLTVITPPDEEPVSLASAKAFLRIGHDDENAIVANLIESARARLEQISGFVLVRQEIMAAWSKWPTAISGRGAQLPKRPVTELVSVKTGTEFETASDHTERFKLDCGRIGLRPWSMRPRLSLGEQVFVTFKAGFGAASDIPEDLREALLRLIASMYRSRTAGAGASGAANGLPEDVFAILNARREVRL